jgi:hypothetical protein
LLIESAKDENVARVQSHCLLTYRGETGAGILREDTKNLRETQDLWTGKAGARHILICGCAINATSQAGLEKLQDLRLLYSSISLSRSVQLVMS